MCKNEVMRTTVNLSDDVAAAVDRLRSERGVGISEAVNELARAGLTVQRQARPFKQRSHDLGRGIDVTNVADALETLDGPTAA
jgi:hypothetical protein